MCSNRKVFEPIENIDVWLDGGSIMLRTTEPHGDPVELTEVEAEELGSWLLELVATQKSGQP